MKKSKLAFHNPEASQDAPSAGRYTILVGAVLLLLFLTVLLIAFLAGVFS